MAQRLKRWESPRHQGRNDKGKGGSARQRQLKKQTQMLRKKLKEDQQQRQDHQQHNQGGRDISSLPFFFEEQLMVYAFRAAVGIRQTKASNIMSA